MGNTVTLRVGTPADRSPISRLRYDVYATELGQYPANDGRRLDDPDDSGNLYLVAEADGAIVGFVSLTPPWAPRLFVERHVGPDLAATLRATTPWEVRALTVHQDHRNTLVATVLMYAALRWIVAQGGRTAVAMGRTDVLPLYERLGLRAIGHRFTAGAVDYDVMVADVPAAQAAFARAYRGILGRLADTVRWELDLPRHPEDRCAHGGRSFDAIGTRFDRLDTKDRIVTADVLDAWFDPAPGVVSALREDVPWLARTSPPAQGDGLAATIARARDLPVDSLVLGAGSSDLMYLAAGRLLGASSRVLLTRPCYGEYPHLAGTVAGARVDHLRLHDGNGWRLDLDELRRALRRGRYDLVVLVNPANPTGGHIDPDALWDTLDAAPRGTTIWLDESYIDYVGPGMSLEGRAAASENIIVCKSLSKVYALSGMRAAYLAAPPHLAAALRLWSPPWAISLPGQVAAVRALEDLVYYEGCWKATASLRQDLAEGLRAALPADVDVVESCANFVLARLPWPGSAPVVCRHCESCGVFIRDLSPLSPDFEGRSIRIAVKDAPTNDRIATTVTEAVHRLRQTG